MTAPPLPPASALPPESESRPRCFALLPCAGSGSRAGTPQPKQYQTVAGQPLVRHTLAALAQVPRVACTLVVVAPGDTALALGAGGAAHEALHEAPKAHVVADCGGASRAESVFNGLAYWLAHGAHSGDWVLVHDAARCLVTPAQINALIDACWPDAVGGLLALPLPDTLKSAAPGAPPAGPVRVAATIDRAGKWLAQTPQMFRIGALHAAYAAHAASGFEGLTDEASAMEAAGHAPLLVCGSAQNFKVTYPEDFALAEAVLRSRLP
ncbi:2-C-methyl-D-erythritol 4-phosphate cytidylyltransferase [Comamonadaceae bacterium OH2545_COT-014]|nr:2-C-methyl-D-erythritol 4-phosphate cytidylyltransferase [Comamonadaceae bacterium OH2545_COT-014]